MSKEASEVREVPIEIDQVIGSNVEPKYRGTVEDRHDMMVLGKKQVLRRNFTSFLTTFGFASAVMVAWEFVLIVSWFSLADGGTPAIFWGLLFSPVVLTPMYMSIAEIVSM